MSLHCGNKSVILVLLIIDLVMVMSYLQVLFNISLSLICCREKNNFLDFLQLHIVSVDRILSKKIFHITYIISHAFSNVT